MRLKKRGFFAVMLAVLLLGFGGPDANAAELFVAPDGDDANPGTKAKPFATLERARDAARELKPDAERRIVVRGGTYYNVSLVLEPADSGLAIEAAAGEAPVLYGGRRVTGWQKDGEAFYAAMLPGVKEGTWDFRSLVIDGELRPRARLPKTGEFTHLTRFDARWHTSDGGGFRGADKPELKLKLRYRKSDLGPWLDVKNAELDILHSWDSSMVGVKSHDAKTQTLHFSNPTGYPPGAFGVHRYVVWNIRQGMHEPGQWYLDRTHGKVVYWPKPGEEIERLTVVAPTTEAILDIKGTAAAPVTGISVNGLHLRCTTTPLKAGGWAAGVFQGAVEARFTRNSTFRSLHITAVGGQGIRLINGQRNTVEACRIEKTGAGGIYAVRGSHSRIVRNLVRGIGQIYVSAIGMKTYDCWKNPKLSHHNEVSHNAVIDVPYIGIECKGVNNRYERNLVQNAMCVLDDGGAFYSTGRGHVFRGNVVRDIDKGKSAHAYYIDELGHGILVENNVAINCSWPVHVHLAHDNTFRNNLFVAEKDCKLTFPRSRNITIEKTAIVAGGTLLVQYGGAVTKWDRNVFFSRAGRYHGLPGNAARRADPLFVDGPKGDLRFKEDSPALQLGIEPLGPADVGPQKKASPVQPKQGANGR
jgi:hypothetical protein